MSRPLCAAALAAVSMSLAACGSTVQMTSQLGPGAGSDGGLSGQPFSSSSSGAVANSLSAASGTGPQVASAAGAFGGGQAQATSSGGTQSDGTLTASAPSSTVSGDAVHNGPGVTQKQINVGMIYSPNADAYQAALGGQQSNADIHADAVAYQDDINQHGGIASRRLNIVFHPVDATSTDSQSTILQAACSDFTQDHKVLVALPSSDSQFVHCMAKAGSVTTDATIAGLDNRTYRSLPSLYDVQALSTDAIVTHLAGVLKSVGYFTGWNAATGAPGPNPVKVGILTPDSPAWLTAGSKTLAKALAAVGVNVNPADIVVWHFPTSNSGDGQAVAEIQSAVLKFRSDNVTHLIPVEINSIAFFAPQAQSQGYHPRYGISTADEIPAELGTLIPTAQMAGAIGMGWSPTVDLPSTVSSSKKYAGPGTAHCFDVMNRHNIALTTDTAKTLALVMCDILESVREVIDTIPKGQAINSSSYLTALGALGSSFKIAALPKARFSPGRPYPVTEGWNMTYNGTCQCFQYSPAPFTLD